MSNLEEFEINSAYFDLERGNAQGDIVSPYIFNLGFQILLFKINYDFQINGAIDQPVVPPRYPPHLQGSRYQTV
jgi:hypothetical protein